jgi:hypothetical protein
MDVSRDQEHDRIHLRDLLTCSATSRVSPVRGSESGGFSAPPKIPMRVWARHSLQVRDTPFKKLRKPASSIPKLTQTLFRPPHSFAECKSRLSLVPSRHSDPAYGDARRPRREGASNPPALKMLYPAFTLKISES